MSRKRYQTIDAKVRQLASPEVAEEIMRCIRETIRFDPEVGMVTPKKAEYMKARVQKIAAEYGVPAYFANRSRAAAKAASERLKIP